MRVTLTVLLALATPVAAQTRIPVPGPVPVLGLAKPCKPHASMAQSREPVRVRPLGAMPPATQALAVYRERNGCAELAVVRERVGAPARR